MKKLLLFVFTGLLITLAACNNRQTNIPEFSSSTDESTLPTDESKKIYVQIVGEVISPGVYEMSEGDRLFHLIKKAGGLTDFADTSNQQQLEKLSDGSIFKICSVNASTCSQQEKIYVEIRGHVQNPGIYELENNSRVFTLLEVAGGMLENGDLGVISLANFLNDEMILLVCQANDQTCLETSKKLWFKNDQQNTNDNIDINTENSLININYASLDLLKTLEGIGEAYAKAIIAYRTENGAFLTIESIMDVDGIGTGIFEKIKNNITV